MRGGTDSYSEVFTTEIEGWCHGIAHYPGEIYPGLVHRIIRELGPSFRIAIDHRITLNIIELSKKISEAAKYLVHEKEVAFSILLQLPRPDDLDPAGQTVLKQILATVEPVYAGANARLERFWREEKRK